jgi:hypothetical protein
MEEDLLCPFHYFGITDLEVDGEAIDGDGLGYPMPYMYYYDSRSHESVRIIVDYMNVWTTGKGIVYAYDGTNMSLIKAVTIRYTKTTS